MANLFEQHIRNEYNRVMQTSAVAATALNIAIRKDVCEVTTLKAIIVSLADFNHVLTQRMKNTDDCIRILEESLDDEQAKNT